MQRDTERLLTGIQLALFSLLLSVTLPSKAADVFVDLYPFPFPENVSILVGDTVVWRAFNLGDNVGSYTNDWKSSTLKPGETFTHTFTTPGIYVYLSAGYSPGTVAVQPLTNSRPVVSIVSPPDGFVVPSDGNLQAVVTIPEVDVKMVQFFDRDKLIGVSTNAPYRVHFLDPDPSAQLPQYLFTAKMIDSDGRTNVSPLVVVKSDRAHLFNLFRLPGGQAVFFFQF